jgi:hypothetical protein
MPMREECAHEKTVRLISAQGQTKDVNWCNTCGAIYIGEIEVGSRDWVVPDRQKAVEEKKDAANSGVEEKPLAREK